MGIPVAVLPVMQPDALGNDLPQKVDHIRLDTFIPVFLDHDGGGGPLDVNRYDAVSNTTGCDNLPYRLGNIDQRFALMCGDGD